MRFSANLGLLWTDLPLPAAILAAADAGFGAVECHWPYETSPEEVRAALDCAGLKMLGLNTAPGDLDAGEFGLSALPGREEEARSAIDRATGYAAAIGARAVHVMAGRAQGDEADAAFRRNLIYACDTAAALGLTVLIEPLNSFDVPGYFLRDTDQAAALIRSLGRPELRLMFDCYHVGRQEGEVAARLERLLPIIGHIQFASIPDRGPPDAGDLCYETLFAHIRRLGYAAPLGAEYRPRGATADSLEWMDRFGG